MNYEKIQLPRDLFVFTKEILKLKLHFLHILNHFFSPKRSVNFKIVANQNGNKESGRQHLDRLNAKNNEFTIIRLCYQFSFPCTCCS